MVAVSRYSFVHNYYFTSTKSGLATLDRAGYTATYKVKFVDFIVHSFFFWPQVAVELHWSELCGQNAPSC